MRRLALLLVPVLLSACDNNYVGSPFVGAGGFLSDTLGLRSNPNRPIGDSPNMRRVTGAEAQTDPLEPEPGNVWPGPLPPAKTILDLQREQGGTPPPIDALPTPSAPLPTPRGSGTPPSPGASVVPALPPPSPTPLPGRPASQAAPSSRVLQTPSGPATTTIGGNGVETYTLPNGRTGIVMPNANGSLTLIGPDGSTQTIPAPR